MDDYTPLWISNRAHRSMLPADHCSAGALRPVASDRSRQPTRTVVPQQNRPGRPLPPCCHACGVPPLPGIVFSSAKKVRWTAAGRGGIRTWAFIFGMYVKRGDRDIKSRLDGQRGRWQSCRGCWFCHFGEVALAAAAAAHHRRSSVRFLHARFSTTK